MATLRNKRKLAAVSRDTQGGARTSRTNDSENREPTGDRSLNDSYPEVEFSVRQASTAADSEREETSHNLEIGKLISSCECSQS